MHRNTSQKKNFALSASLQPFWMINCVFFLGDQLWDQLCICFLLCAQLFFIGFYIFCALSSSILYLENILFLPLDNMSIATVTVVKTAVENVSQVPTELVHDAFSDDNVAFPSRWNKWPHRSYVLLSCVTLAHRRHAFNRVKRSMAIFHSKDDLFLFITNLLDVVLLTQISHLQDYILMA